MAPLTGEKTCFIAMPVTTTKAHAEVFGDVDHWKHVMEALFVPAIEAAGFIPWRPVARGSHLIHAEIVRQLERADLVLCDLSHNNPNVFFELGVRTSVNKPVALVRCDAETPIPFDVSGINTHTYDPSLRAWLIESEIEALTSHLREAESSCDGENPMWRQFGLVLKAQEPSASETREDAMLSLVSGQVAELSHRVEEIARDRESERNVGRDLRGVFGMGYVGRTDPSASSGTYFPVEAIQRLVNDTAEEFGVDADVQVDYDGVKVRVRGTAQETQEFRNRVHQELQELDVPVRISLLVARPSRS